MSHRCRCTGPVEGCRPSGLALFTESPEVEPLLDRAFRRSPDHPRVFLADGEGFVEDLRDLLGTLSAAERAMIKAAAIQGDGRVDPWSAIPLEKSLARLDSAWLPELINREALRFDYQPIVHADTLEVFGQEALLRSAPPFDGHSPGDLFRAARAHDALLALDQRARRLAITEGYPRVPEGQLLFVNFLPTTVYDPNVCLRTTFEAAREAGVAPARLVFEVVETELFPDIDHLDAIMRVYRRQNVMVALDDLGAGATSLTFLDRLMPDFIKLDRELIARATADGEASLVAGIADHARRRGVRVIAEGIETPEELAFARRIGADYVQGYLIARPASSPVQRIDRALAA